MRQSTKDNMVDIVEIATEQFESPREDYQRLNLTSPNVFGGKDRVKSAAAGLIHRKWGYDTTGVLQGTNINMDTFMRNGSMKEQHASLMRRLDGSLEDLALNQHTAELQAWTNDKTRVLSEKQTADDNVKSKLVKVPDLNEIYTKPVSRIIDPLARNDALKLKQMRDKHEGMNHWLINLSILNKIKQKVLFINIL
jgi:hypothetical protein